MAQTTFMD